MMKRTASILTAAVVAFAGFAATFESPAEAGKRGRNIAAGIALGVAAAAIIANSNRAEAHERSYYRSSSYRARCERWLRQCDYGNDYACDKFEARC